MVDNLNAQNGCAGKTLPAIFISPYLILHAAGEGHLEIAQ